MPAPLVPSSATISPSSTSKSTSKSTCTPLYSTHTLRHTSSLASPASRERRASSPAIDAANALRRSRSNSGAALSVMIAPRTMKGTPNNRTGVNPNAAWIEVAMGVQTRMLGIAASPNSAPLSVRMFGGTTCVMIAPTAGPVRPLPKP